ncbi:acetylcholine receptor subunit alpha-like [Pecten maximus]|uniref:acetylcholine receptor subunit alpha-like n=1 Tax=Pecten maximus TaxID=6579 RepID=UPI001458F9A9|nr:acetylcholine receptor subunit alpha-like [Pecten maximus]
MTRLKFDLLQDYTKSNLPVRNQNDTVFVNVSIYFRMVKEFNIVESVLGTHLFFQLHWIDEYIHWDSEDYDNITAVNFPLLDVWVPPMVVVNPADNYGFIGEKDTLLVEYSSVGLASLVFSAYIKSTCKPFIKYFPFDSHICHVMISQIGYGMGDVIPLPSQIYKQYIVDNGQWVVDALDLTQQPFIPGENESVYVDLSIQLSRRPDFLLLNLFIPIAFLICMNMFVFFLPAECGEKASYSITVLLSLAIFMTIVMDQLPPLSTEVPVISIILCIHLANNVIVCTCTILSLNYHHRRESRKISWHLRLMTMLVTWRSYKSDCKVPNRISPESFHTKTEEKDLGMTDTDDVTQRDVVSGETDRRPVLTWQKVSHAIDRWNFFICVLMTILEMGLVFYHSSYGE